DRGVRRRVGRGRRVGYRRRRGRGEVADQRVPDAQHAGAIDRVPRRGVRPGHEGAGAAAAARRGRDPTRRERPVRLGDDHREESVPAGDPFRAAASSGPRRSEVTARRSAISRRISDETGHRMTITNVGVIGCGLMGSGIVQVAAQAGFQVLFVEASDELVKRGLGRLRETLEGLLSKGKLDAKAKDAALACIAGTTRLEELKSCDLVVEAMTENQPLKNETFAKLDGICPPHAILASNTSSCNVTAMAAATGRPGQVLGLHFFNPVPLMKLVEVVFEEFREPRYAPPPLLKRMVIAGQLGRKSGKGFYRYTAP